MKIFLLLSTLFCLNLANCTKKEEAPQLISVSPEEVVRNFITLSSQAKETRDKSRLSDFCQGDMKAAFDGMSDEQFRLFYLNGNVNVKELRITGITKEKNKAVVQYQVLVENRQGTDVTHETNEREVELSEVSNGWVIEAVRPKGTDKLVFSKGMVF
jgi:hypothetical protein